MLTRRSAEEVLERAIADGFERSHIVEPDGPDESYAVRIRCSRCQALVINGMATHETGCPVAHTAREQETFDLEEACE